MKYPKGLNKKNLEKKKINFFCKKKKNILIQSKNKFSSKLKKNHFLGKLEKNDFCEKLEKSNFSSKMKKKNFLENFKKRNSFFNTTKCSSNRKISIKKKTDFFFLKKYFEIFDDFEKNNLRVLQIKNFHKEKFFFCDKKLFSENLINKKSVLKDLEKFSKWKKNFN